MKYRYLSIFLIVLILSIGAVSAQEDAASDDSIGTAQDGGVLSSLEIVIDDNNYNDYFDDSGMILETSNISDGDTIKLGNVSNKDFYIIDKFLVITSNSSSDVLTNVSLYFMEGSDNSTISNLHIGNSEKPPITVYSAKNIEISNNVINVVAIKGIFDLYAIYAYYANNLIVESNNITYSGKTDGNASNAVIYVSESDNVEISLNDIDASLMSCPIEWRQVGYYDYMPNCPSQAIYLGDCNNVEFLFNDIYAEYSDFIGSEDTIYVVNVYNCEDVEFDKNTIEGIGHTYIYGAVIRAEDFTLYGNEINMVSDEKYAAGIDIEGKASGNVQLNRIFLESPYVSYGIYACNWNMFGQTVNYSSNIIYAESYAAYGMELLYGDESLIEGNEITLHGNYTVGIGEIMLDGPAVITSNEINVFGTNKDMANVGDSVPAVTVAIFSMGESKINNNIITSAGNWTIINSYYDVEITDNYLVSSELLGDDSVNDTSDDAVVENNLPIANATNYNVTKGNFYLFFDEDGELRDGITAESLTFIGEFSELTDQIVIGRPVALYSDNATLYDMGLLIASNDVYVDGFKFISNGINQQIRIISSDNVVINNSEFIMNGDDEIGNNVMYIVDSNNVSITDNQISFTVETNETYENAVICAKGCEDLTIDGNNINALLPARSINWSTGTVYSQGVFIKDCDDAVLENNWIQVQSNGQIGEYDTIYGVNIIGDNANVEGNTIIVRDAPYSYGLLISGGNFLIEDNNFAIYGENNYSCGIDIEGESDGSVNENDIGVVSSGVAYGIYACDWNMDGQAVDYTGNNIEGEAPTIYGMELLFGEESLIDGNVISINGNYTIGIAEMMLDAAAVITNNEINVFGTNKDMVNTGDMVPAVTVGIFSMGESEIKDNAITSTGNWTIINSYYDVEITGNYLVASELLGDDSVNDTTDEAIVENNLPLANATNYNVTNDTFFLFFNERGLLRENITAESLTFIGEFSDLTIWNEISRPIRLISDNATLYDMSFVISSDDVTLDGFTFISKDLSQIITVYGDNVQITNNTFMVDGADDDNNYVIYISEADEVLIYNNSIFFNVETNETNKNMAIYAEESEKLSIFENTIYSRLPARSVDWISGTVYSQGVFLNDCDYADLYNNTIAVMSNDQISTYDTIYTAYILGDNATIIKNQIGVIEAPYGYALVVAGKNFKIQDNIIAAVENGTYACGIDIESNSEGLIGNNNIYAAGESAYGIYTANWAGPVKAEIIDNEIYVDANSAFGMSLSGSEISVENNSVLVKGNFTTGIASAVDMVFITNNTIIVEGSNIGTPAGYDTMGIETIGVHAVSGDALVKNNNITSSGVFAVEVGGTGAVTDNELRAKTLTGDLAVDYIQDSGVLVVNNTPEMELDYILTNDTFYAYFDKEGRLREEIKSDNLTFVGEFSNLVDEIIIDVPITLLSDNAVLNNMVIEISSDNVTVDGFTFVGEFSGIGVYEADNVQILNNNITILNSTDSNVGIEIIDSNNVLVDGNTVILSVMPNNGTYFNDIIYAKDSDDLIISNNEISGVLPARPVDPDTEEVYSHGVCLYDCDGVGLYQNIINVTTSDVSGNYATIFAVEVAGDNAEISNNAIIIEAPYSYALVISGENFVISDNLISAGGDNEYAFGIYIDGEASGSVDKNLITVNSADVAYGVYACAWGDHGQTVNYTNNDISGEAPKIYGMELLYGEETLVDCNKIILNGNYTMGIAEDSDVVITNNDIFVYGTNNDFKPGDIVSTAVTVGIFSMGESQINNNAITSAGIYTILNLNNYAEITYNYLVSSVLLGDDSVNDGTGYSRVENNIPVAGATDYNLTNDTFFLYFDDNGKLRDNITAESLTFIGEFSNLVDIIIDEPIKLLSDYATLDDITIFVNSNNVTVDGFKFIGKKSGIWVNGADNIEISNNEFDIDGYADCANIVIYIEGSYGVLLNNNNISFTVESNETYQNAAIYVKDSNDLIIYDNVIVAELPARSIDWYSGTVYSQGICLDNCDNADLYNNNISVRANDQISTYDTIYAVNIVGDNATIYENQIAVAEAPYGYALVVTGKGFEIADNVIAAGKNGTYACGIDIESNSEGVIDDNKIYAAGESAYGIYTANWAGPVKANITNNEIYVDAVSAFGMSLSGSEMSVDNNSVLVEGNFTTGIASAADFVFITNNTIIVNGSDVGTPVGYDSMGIETIGVHAVSGDALVKDNNITSSGVFAVEVGGTGAVTDNELYAKTLTGDLAVDYMQNSGVLVADNIPEMELNYIVTNDTFFAYFDKQGKLREEIKSDNLTFVGEFSNLIDEIIIDVPIELLSDNAVLNNMAIEITSDNVTVDGFTFVGELSGIGVYEADNVQILNNNITISNSTIDSNVAIDIIDSNNVLVDGNILLLSVMPNNGTYSNNVIYAAQSDDLIISNNIIAAELPARPVNWTSGEVFSQGVFINDCDNATLSGNYIGVRSNDQISTYDTIYAVGIEGDNATVVDNQIVVLEAPYGYGLVVTGDNFNISDNKIAAGENGTYACGIDIESNSAGSIDNNTIVAAGESAYGIYTANWAGDVKANITDNKIIVDAVSAFGMSLSASEMSVENNTISVYGNYTTGIASAVDKISINNNTINAGGSDVGTPAGYDMMGIETTGIHIVRGRATVTENNVTTTGEYAVDMKDAESHVFDNNLVAKDLTGDASVDYVLSQETGVDGNVPLMEKVFILSEDVVMYYRNGTRYVVTLMKASGDLLANKTVVITVNGVSYTKVTDKDGVASLGIGLGSGNYTVTASFTGDGSLGSATAQNNITVLSTVFGDDLVKVYKNASQYEASFVDGQGNALVNTEVTFNINGVMYKKTTDANGTARLNINLPQGNYIITAINPVNGEMHANNITVLPRIVENNDITKYYKNDTQYTVKLIGDDGNPVGAGEVVTFNINGVFYNRTTDDNGVAQLNINLPPGDYIITADYKGCKVSNNIKVLPVLSAEDLVKKYGTPGQFVATLVDGQGNPYEGQTVTFNINGVFYNKVTDNNGQAKLNINLPAGEYIITSSYNGANIANKITVTA